MAILDWIYPKKCLGCGVGGRYVCEECQRGIERRGESLKYVGIVRQAIKEIKYRGVYDLVDELVEIWNPSRLDGVNIVTCVPMWKGKLLKRGYNQAELIAKNLAERWGVKYLDLLVRTRETKPMYGLSKAGRLENIQDAFELSSVGRAICLNASLRTTRIVLVDDVMTSGATIRECKNTLNMLPNTQIYTIALSK